MLYFRFVYIFVGSYEYTSTTMCVLYTSQSRIGNWSVEVGGSVLSGPRGSGLQVQARLDGREKIWLNGTAEGPCLQSTAGYMNGEYI